MNRADRRKLRAEKLGKVSSHPVAKRLLSNYEKYGRISAEFYTQYDDGSGKPRYFDVFSAKLWCSRHKAIVPVIIDQAFVEELCRNGSINSEHLEMIEFTQEVAPVIFLNGATNNGQILLDGAHRYVAFAREIKDKELEDSVRMIPAYILEPKEWKQFVIPQAVAEAFQMTA